MHSSIKQILTTLTVLGVLGSLSACGNLSRGVAPDGHTADALVWPAPGDTTPMHKGGTFPNVSDVRQVKAGLNKQQLAALVGFPHFSEGVVGVREWNYLFNFRDANNKVSTCQFKVLFDQNKLAQSFYWLPESCAKYQQADAVAKSGPSSEQFVLSTDALFAFDRATVADITDDGKTQLDQLTRNLLTHKTRVENIHIMGYTDRLGSDSHNDSLSGRRAYAVMNYLVEQGVPSELIQAEGLGKADPVRSCDDADRAALIDCLAPNRRVVVLVNLLEAAGENSRATN
ncbi:OmpA family protein [Dyella koreensis]|uniref:OmpA family protein n=1 Tax=Dyella koreensis TaxID=311235 RepID=A0ABW8K9F3_9GAMM